MYEFGKCIHLPELFTLPSYCGKCEQGQKQKMKSGNKAVYFVTCIRVVKSKSKILYVLNK